jgi:hypothetical protein
MSLYALPGLFPPLAFKETTSSSSTLPQTDSSAAELTTGASRRRGSCPDCNRMEDEPARDASWEKDREFGISAGGGQLSPSSSLETANAAKGSSLAAPVVAIREARIDAARLIHSIILGTGKGPRGAAPANRRADPPPGPTSRARIQRRSRASSSDPAGGEGGENHAELPITPHEECMVFELAVRLENAEGSCWSFETTRRLECFLELRRELVRELQSSSSHDGGCCIPPVPRVQHDESSSTFDGGMTNMGGGGALACGNGAGRGGFVFLQALIRSYVPVLERWLRTVLEKLPVSDPKQSYALSRFLRQPRLDDPLDEGREALSDASTTRSMLVPSSTAPSPSRNPPYSSSVSPSQSATSFRPLDSIEESEEVEG